MNAPLHEDAPLAYRLLGASQSPRRLLVLAHGVGGNETNLASLGAQAPADTATLLVRAPLVIGIGQYAWFPVVFTPGGPQPDLGAAERSRVLLADFVSVMQQRLGVAQSATVIAGFSQGGIMSASVGLTEPPRVAGFAVLAGRILPELAPQVAPRQALTHVRALVAHGRDDAKLPVDWAHRADAWLNDLGIDHELRLYPGGHAITPSMQEDLLAWFDRVTRPAAVTV
ncbi:MAG: alpha/beta hydrolase [Pseudomonadota bacterium]